MDHQIQSPPPYQSPPYYPPPAAAAAMHHHQQQQHPAAPPMMQSHLANYPLRNIAQPHYHDVLCGRGGGTNAHVGNSHWRMLVAANKELYVTLPKKQKMLLSKSIVNAVRSQTPPGRFLQKDPKTNLWYDVGDQRAQEKTSQALREGAPDIRTKIKGSEDETAADPATGAAEVASPESSSGTTSDKKLQAKPSPKGSPPPPPPPQPQHSMVPPMPPQSMPQMGSPHMPPPHPVMYSSPHPSMQGGGGGPPPRGYGNNMVLSPQGVPVAAAGSPYLPSHHMAGAPPPPIPPPIPAQGPVRERRPGKHAQPQQQQYQLKDPPPQRDSSADAVAATINKTSQPSPEQSSRSKAPPSGDNAAYSDNYGSRSYLPPQHRNPSLEPIPVVVGSSSSSTRNSIVGAAGDGGVPHPPTGLIDEDQGCSFGSIIMTDLEQARLMNGGSFGTNSTGVPPNTTVYGNMKPPSPAAASAAAGAARPSGMQVHFREEDLAHKPARRPSPTSYPAFPVDGGLESSVGVSFGSLMSIGSSNSGGPTRLETGGLSFGSPMSYSVRGDVPPAVDGGLEGIGTSFGSLSLDREKVLPPGGLLEDVGTSFGSMTISTQDRDDLLNAVGANAGSEQEASPSAVAAMEKLATQTFLAQQKSKGSLLECSDTESEDEEQSAQNSAQKSAEWDKLQATLAAQSKIPMASNVPPALSSKRQSRRQPETVPIDIQAAPFNRDYSQMSAISLGDGDFAQYQEQVMPEVDGAYNDSDDQNAMPPPPPPPPMQQRRQPHVDDEDFDDFNALRMLSSQQKRGLMD